MWQVLHRCEEVQPGFFMESLQCCQVVAGAASSGQKLAGAGTLWRMLFAQYCPKKPIIAEPSRCNTSLRSNLCKALAVFDAVYTNGYGIPTLLNLLLRPHDVYLLVVRRTLDELLICSSFSPLRPDSEVELKQCVEMTRTSVL